MIFENKTLLKNPLVSQSDMLRPNLVKIGQKASLRTKIIIYLKTNAIDTIQSQ